MHRGKAYTIPVYEYILQGKSLDLGTMLANLATTTWVEGALTTRNSDYSLKVCQVHPRLQRAKSERSIENPYNGVPRRLWDLVNNRVVDIDVFAKRGENGEIVSPRMPVGGYWAISHSWTSDMQRWMTPVNNYRWPVPLPSGVTLEDIRWEALRAGAVYCWLDVLCLRQRMEECSYDLIMRDIDGKEVFGSDHRKDCSGSQHTEVNQTQRLDEWALDVPTIGNNYRQATFVLRYFNGLGRSLSLSGWDDPRHWINRAWTLQESRPEYIMVNASIPEGIHHPLQAMVEIAGKRHPIQHMLLPLARLIEDAEAEYVPHKSMLERALPLWAGNVEFSIQVGILTCSITIAVCGFISMSSENYCIPHDPSMPMSWVFSGGIRCVLLFGLWSIIGGVGIHFSGQYVKEAILLWISFPGRTKTVAIKLSAAVMLIYWAMLCLTSQILHIWMGLISLYSNAIFITAVILSAYVWLSQHWLAAIITGCAKSWDSYVRQQFMRLRRPNPVGRTGRFCSILALAQEMSRREASNERDKISGLGYLMKCTNLPTYAEEEPLEDAWLHLVSHLPYAAQLELLFNFPKPRLHGDGAHGDGAHGAWIPTWKQVTSIVPDASQKLQRPSWPPRWLFEEKVSTSPRLLVGLSHDKIYDEASRALLVPCCGRVLLCTEIRLVTEGPWTDFGSRTPTLDSYAVTISASLDRSKRLIHYFYCPHNESLLPADARSEECSLGRPITLLSQGKHIYFLISHGRDDEAGTLSWVVGRALQPSTHWNTEFRFQNFYHETRLIGTKLSPEIRRLTVDAFGLTEDEAIRTLVVEKIGVLVTDDMRPLTATDISFCSSSVTNVPVVFV